MVTYSDMVIAVDYVKLRGKYDKYEKKLEKDKWNAAATSRDGRRGALGAKGRGKKKFHIFFINHHENILAAENYHELSNRNRNRKKQVKVVPYFFTWKMIHLIWYMNVFHSAGNDLIMLPSAFLMGCDLGVGLDKILQWIALKIRFLRNYCNFIW